MQGWWGMSGTPSAPQTLDGAQLFLLTTGLKIIPASFSLIMVKYT